MNLVYLDNWHFCNADIMPDEPVVVKVGVDALADLIQTRVLYPKARIIAYEADPGNYKRWKKTGKNVVDEFVNQAVGIDGPVILYQFEAHGSHSTMPRHLKEKHCKYMGQIQVNSIGLPKVVEKAAGRIDLLILNCEGSELPILRSLYDESVRNAVHQICVSFHDPRMYNTGKKMDILARLKPFYHVQHGTAIQLPDYLLMRKA